MSLSTFFPTDDLVLGVKAGSQGLGRVNGKKWGEKEGFFRFPFLAKDLENRRYRTGYQQEVHHTES